MTPFEDFIVYMNRLFLFYNFILYCVINFYGSAISPFRNRNKSLEVMPVTQLAIYSKFLQSCISKHTQTYTHLHTHTYIYTYTLCMCIYFNILCIYLKLMLHVTYVLIYIYTYIWKVIHHVKEFFREIYVSIGKGK